MVLDDISFYIIEKETFQKSIAIVISAASVVTDINATKKYQATIESASNGVPIVNIVKPNSNGLSHNKFSDYNVNQQGLILNNSNKSKINTQLSGYIYGNKNLTAGNTASTILNEVTSKNKTQLRGYTEVAGDSARVIVANPNGILINGAGFINTPKATITTGTPNFTDDKLLIFYSTPLKEAKLIEDENDNFFGLKMSYQF